MNKRKLKYPRVPPELDLRRKLMPEDIEMIKEKYENGISCPELGRQYGVSKSCIQYHVLPEYHRQTIEATKIRMKDVPKDILRARRLKSQRRLYNIVAGLREWTAKKMAENRKNLRSH
jgi:hypothetical protein